MNRDNRHPAKLCLLALILTGVVSLSAVRAQAPPIASFNWLVGTWHSQNHGDDIQETYVPAAGGQILVLFQAVTKGQVSRIEIRSLREQGGQIILQELAFRPGLILDKSVATRTFVSGDATHAVFTGMTMTKTGDNAMTVGVKVATPGDPSGVVELKYTRAPNLAPQ